MKKFDKGYVFYRIFCDFFLLIASAFILSGFLLSGDDHTFIGRSPEKFFTLAMIIFAVLFAVDIALIVLYVNFSGYKLDTEQIKCKRGVIYKKTSVIEFSKIHSINKKQNFIQKLFNIATLSIDSGSATTPNTPEIFIIERSDVIDRLIRDIKLRQAGVTLDDGQGLENQNDIYNFGAALKVLYSLLIFAWALIISLFAVVIITSVSFFAIYFSGSDIPKPSFFAAAKSITLLGVTAFIVSSIFFVFGLIGAFLKFFDYKLCKSGDTITISYGLFLRNTETFSTSKNKAVVIKQNPLQRIFGLCSVYLKVVGFSDPQNSPNDENVGSGLIIPLCKVSNKDQLIAALLPDYVPDKKRQKPTYLKTFLFLKYIFSFTVFVISAYFAAVIFALLSKLCVITLPESFLQVYITALALILPIVFGIITPYAIFEKLTAGVSVSEDKITLYTGGFTSKCYVIKKENVIALESVTTPYRKKLNVCTYKIHFYSNASENVVAIKNLDDGLYNELYACVNK